MDEIEVVIKIDKDTFKKYQESVDCEERAIIVHGTPLPKGHGRIGDLDSLERDMIGGIKAANFEEGYADYAHINNVDDCV